MKLKTYLLYILVLSQGYVFAQKKALKSIISNEKITIDGEFSEQIWEQTDVAKDFVMLEPDNGKAEEPNQKTEVRIVYNNDGIYIAAKLFDTKPNTILREITNRDEFGTSDHFGIFINGYNDGQQDFRFFVSAAGVQMDCIYTESNGEDYSWNAIWDSKTKFTNEGWQVEIKIPYAAIRFPKTNQQKWGINFYREIMSLRRQYTWNRIDNNISNTAIQAGTLEGIENISTPTRLFLIPYSSFYLKGNNSAKTYGETLGGMDVKYGINDAFTLDAILIPDFGQTKFDNVVLNLGPFEQQFNENRPFFTEGTELFSKGDLLYSRRIGGMPNYKLSSTEVFQGTNKINLINALKISGRTKNGLGIGVLNAVSEKTNLEIYDYNTDTVRNEEEPLSNYSIVTLDQRFRQNCSVSVVNSNVTRNGSYRDANVSAFLFDLNTKKNTYNLSGNYKYSIIKDGFHPENNTLGYNTALRFAETSGKVRFAARGEYVSTNFDPNDLGINFQTHYHSLATNISYRILNPTKKMNGFNTNLYNYIEFDNRTGRLQNNYQNLNFNITNKKNDYYGFGLMASIFDYSDFYEPRSIDDSKFLLTPRSGGVWFFLSTNYNRKFALDFNPSFSKYNQQGRYDFDINISPRFRFSNKLLVVLSSQFSHKKNNIGWVDFDNNNTIIARRNRDTFNNSITTKYAINPIMSVNLAVRHYYSYAVNNEYNNLLPDGNLELNNQYNYNSNSSFNSWNMDLSYSWWFAPGSQLSILYRNNATLYNREFSRNYSLNTKDILNNEYLNHMLSISIRYFIDYNQAKNWFSK